jgi:MFS family permease
MAIGLLFALIGTIEKDSSAAEPISLAAVLAALTGMFAVGGCIAAVVPMSVRYGSTWVDRHGKTRSRGERIAWGALFGLMAMIALIAITLITITLYYGMSSLSSKDTWGGYAAVLFIFGPAVVGLAYAYVTIDDEDVIKA